MKRSLTIFFQVVIVALGIGVLVFMLWEPQVEGRNLHSTQFQIYFNDPFLAYAYTASVAFFALLYNAFKAVGYVGQNNTYSQQTLKALRAIKYCAIILVAMIFSAVLYLWIVRPGDDIAGGVAMGLFLTLISAIIAILAGKLERRVQRPA